MSDVTRILAAIKTGDPHAAGDLLPLVYDELRKLAAQKLAQEKPGQTLQATALIHEAYLRLMGGGELRHGESRGSTWDHRGHFFAAAAEAMRRILTDTARRKLTTKHGGQVRRVEANDELSAVSEVHDPAETLAVHEILDRLAEQHPRKAQVVKLRYFMGCTQDEAAEILGITVAMVQEDWMFARAWFKREWRKGDSAVVSSL